jgi:hypothetical protein
MTLSRDAIGRYVVSAIVVGILSIQAVAGFVETGRWGWPLLAYPMYKTAHYEGDRLDDDLAVYAVMADSSRVEVKRSDLNMVFFVFWYNVVQPIRYGQLDLLEPVVQRYCKQFDNQVIKLQAEDLGIAIGRDGPIEGLPPEIHFETEVSCS